MAGAADIRDLLKPGDKLPSGLPPLTEKDVAGQVDDFMKAHGWRKIRHSAGTAQRIQDGLTVGMMNIGEPGMPDRQYIHYLGRPGSGVTLTVWVELKRSKGGKRRDSQVAWHAREVARGGLIYSGENDGRRFDIDHYRDWYYKILAPKVAKLAGGQKGLFG